MKGDKRDDRGMSLVELLTALAVSAVVLTGIAYMLVTSLKLSERNNANVQMQNEVQTAMTILTDNIMEAKGIGLQIPGSGESTDCILFGDIAVKKNGTDYETYYKGNAVVADVGAGKAGEIYLIEFPNKSFGADAEGYCKLAASSTEASSVSYSMAKVRKFVMDTAKKDRVKWLLARNVIEFSLLPGSVYGEKTVTVKGVDTVKNFFEEPFTVQVSLTAESPYGGGSLNRTLGDRVSVRNRIHTVYVTKPGQVKDDMETYERER